MPIAREELGAWRYRAPRNTLGQGLAVAAQMAAGVEETPERKCLERIRWVRATDRIMLPLKKS